MTPSQRAAALRLVDNMNLSLETWIEQAENLLRELLAEPVQDRPTTSSQFESVKEAKRVAEYELRYYRKMMDEKNAAEPQGEPVQEPVAWIHRAQYLLAHAENSPPADKMLENGWEPLYAAPQQRKPLTPSMQAEVECDCLVAWNASTYGHSAQDTVHPMFLSAFLRGYRAAERAHGITGEPT